MVKNVVELILGKCSCVDSLISLYNIIVDRFRDLLFSSPDRLSPIFPNNTSWCIPSHLLATVISLPTQASQALVLNQNAVDTLFWKSQRDGILPSKMLGIFFVKDRPLTIGLLSSGTSYVFLEFHALVGACCIKKPYSRLGSISGVLNSR